MTSKCSVPRKSCDILIRSRYNGLFFTLTLINLQNFCSYSFCKDENKIVSNTQLLFLIWKYWTILLFVTQFGAKYEIRNLDQSEGEESPQLWNPPENFVRSTLAAGLGQWSDGGTTVTHRTADAPRGL